MVFFHFLGFYKYLFYRRVTFKYLIAKKMLHTVSFCGIINCIGGVK
jgi:hypothetical protein